MTSHFNQLIPIASLLAATLGCYFGVVWLIRAQKFVAKRAGTTSFASVFRITGENIEQIQHETEMRFRLLVESIKDYAIFVLDPKGYIMTWNAGAEKIKGYKAHEIIGSHFSRFYSEDFAKSGACDLELEHAKVHGSFEDSGWRYRKDGTRFWANVVITAIRDSNGHLLGFAKLTRDLTERKIAEEALRMREAQLREALAIAHMGNWEWDITTDKITWSDELFTIFDVDKNDFDPSYSAYLDRMPRSRRDHISETINRAIKSGKDFSFEYRIDNDDGTNRYIQSRGRIVVDPQGKVLKVLGTSQDISERKKIEEELLQSKIELEKRVLERTAQLKESLERERRAKESAQAANNAKLQFLANMSHEIRTPMNSILGFSELLMSELLNEEQKDHLKRIKSNGDQLLSLIDDILDLSKFEAGQVPIERKNISLVQLLRDVIDTFSTLAERKGIKIVFEEDPESPKLINSDPVRLRQIFTNLIGNSVKFSETGSIKLRVRHLKGDPTDPNSHLMIDVEDTGIGISEEDQRKLFQPFSQADSSIVRKFGGTGLGLALSRRLAEALGGNLILVNSTLGVGSLFRLTLNHFDVAEDESANESDDAESIASNQQTLLHEKYRILLAEDSIDNEVLVRKFLQSTNIVLDVARDGFEALDKIYQTDYDLVLMDIQMPGLDGLEATRRLRLRGFKKPIIALTAHALREEISRSQSAGCNLHLTKPIQRQQLLEAIQSQIKETQRPRSTPPQPTV
jgi:PAS domain S-box-containing protein